jgi:hypothetical protein
MLRSQDRFSRLTMAACAGLLAVSGVVAGAFVERATTGHDPCERTAALTSQISAPICQVATDFLTQNP